MRAGAGGVLGLAGAGRFAAVVRQLGVSDDASSRYGLSGSRRCYGLVGQHPLELLAERSEVHEASPCQGSLRGHVTVRAPWHWQMTVTTRSR